ALTLVLVGDPGSGAFPAIKAAFAAKGAFWSYKSTAVSSRVNGFGSRPPVEVEDQGGARIGPAEVDTSGFVGLPTDDWPFLSLREPTIPALNLRGMAVVALLSLAVLAAFAPVRTARPNGQMFFLGAGFMLLETKGVVHMALLFGSTWVVNSFVFFAILVLVLLSNLYVVAVRPRRLWPYYAWLAAALAVNAARPITVLLGL